MLAKCFWMEYSIFTHFSERGSFTLTLGFIGAGNMATAILDGTIKNHVFLPAEIIISNPHEDKLAYPKSLGVSVTRENCEVIKNSDIIILSVKPQMLESVLHEIKAYSAGKCFVSIAAGISIEWIREILPDAHVIRVMPNTPLQVGVGATAIAEAPTVPDSFFQTVCDVFSAAGLISVIPENLMDAVISVNGSSPAFFFRMANVMTKWANEQGINPDAALQLIASTMMGAAEMLLKSGKNAEELTRQVCSPGGTTLAALTAFDERNFDGLMMDAMTRCLLRARELGK